MEELICSNKNEQDVPKKICGSDCADFSSVAGGGSWFPLARHPPDRLYYPLPFS